MPSHAFACLLWQVFALRFVAAIDLSAAKSLATIAAYRAECDEQSLPFVDLSAAAKVGTDGIHFKAEAARPIAEAVAAALRGALWGVG